MAPNISLRMKGLLPEDTQSKLHAIVNSTDTSKTTVDDLCKRIQGVKGIITSLSEVYFPINPQSVVQELAPSTPDVNLVVFEEVLYKLEKDVDLEQLSMRGRKLHDLSIPTRGEMFLCVAPERRDFGECGMQIFVKTLTGKTMTIDCSPQHTVLDIQYCVQHKEGIPPDQQKLIYAGRQLEPKQTLAELNICQNATIHLVLYLRGGMHHETSGRIDFNATNFCSLEAPKQRLDPNRSVAPKRVSVAYDMDGIKRTLTLYTHPNCSFSVVQKIVGVETDPTKIEQMTKEELTSLLDQFGSSLSRGALLNLIKVMSSRLTMQLRRTATQ